MKTWIKLSEQLTFGLPRMYRPGAWIIRNGDPAELVYLLVSGVAEEVQDLHENACIVTQLLAAPAMLGAREVVCGAARFASSFRARTEARVYTIEREAFLEWMTKLPTAAMEVTQTVCLSLRLVARVTASTAFTCDSRLANLLVSYADVFGTVDDKGTHLGIRCSQSDMALAIGATERSVNRLLTMWKRAGILSKRRGRYTIHDVPYLLSVAAQLGGSLVYRWMNSPSLLSDRDGASTH